MDRNDVYQKTREDLLKRLLSNDENFDRSILTLSSAALGLSVAFLRGGTNNNCFAMLVLAWMGFLVAMVSTLVSFLASQKGIVKQLELAERYYLRDDEGALTEVNIGAIVTERCRYVSVTAFILATIALLAYFAINLPLKEEKDTMSGEKRITSAPLKHVEGGASVPQMQAVPMERGATVPPLQTVRPTTGPASEAPQGGTGSPSSDSSASGGANPGNQAESK